jgi:hypothetical protein
MVRVKRMAESAAVSSFPASKVVGLSVSGRIVRKRVHERVHYVQLILPSPDEYSGPAHIEVRSPRSLGDIGDDVTVRLSIGGYKRRSYQFTDRETGETRMVHPVENTLQVID